MKVVKPAATIMLARELDNEIEVLLLKRNKALAFAAGLWVFPGGKIERFEQEQSTSDLEAARLAAVRETVEEANISIDPAELVFFSHWTTPAIEPRRYATWFFFGDVTGRTLDIKVDDSEIKKHQWVNPQRALDKIRTGELAMMPPTYVSLQLIRKCRTIAEIKAKLTETNPIFILPVLRLVDGKMVCLYQGDAGYDSGEVDAAGPRHRLIANMVNGHYEFEYEGCEHITPVNLGMHL